MTSTLIGPDYPRFDSFPARDDLLLSSSYNEWCTLEAATCFACRDSIRGPSNGNATSTSSSAVKPRCASQPHALSSRSIRMAMPWISHQLIFIGHQASMRVFETRNPSPRLACSAIVSLLAWKRPHRVAVREHRITRGRDARPRKQSLMAPMRSLAFLLAPKTG